MGKAKGPHKRHRYGVCPTCGTEVQTDDRKANVLVCPECETHVPIFSGDPHPELPRG